MDNIKETLIIVGVTVFLFSGIIWLATPAPAPESAGHEHENLVANVSAVLAVNGPNYDFGPISMAKGKVSHLYSAKNTSSEPMNLVKLYTSCMCTSATLIIDGVRKGPFGMPGHAAIPTLNLTIPAGKEFQVEAVFDPAAHGPAGVGTIARTVTLETSTGSAKMNFSAVVTP